MLQEHSLGVIKGLGSLDGGVARCYSFDFPVLLL